uniref:Uncharacterized protein n=1 Tax=Panagrolaimus sp. JU765 TaxID=591449 RepID=A0AC34RM85_9BILA
MTHVHIRIKPLTLERQNPPPVYPRGMSSPPQAPVLPPKPARSSALVIENRLNELSPNSSLNRRTIGAEIAADFQNRQKQLLNYFPDDSLPNSGNTSHSSNPESVLDHNNREKGEKNFTVETGAQRIRFVLFLSVLSIQFICIQELFVLDILGVIQRDVISIPWLFLKICKKSGSIRVSSPLIFSCMMVILGGCPKTLSTFSRAPMTC